ncbi:hypothetical protein [Halorubrum sp. DTA98]|uniref:hypothetical protein n=1 Tax=Halorubrum sp. DTA98 TaxID=3402163 RepID=UPI003AAF2EB3
MTTATDRAERIADLAAAASDARERVCDAPADGPIPERDSGEETAVIAGTEATSPDDAALIAARDGLGPVVALYVEARTGGEWIRFSETEMKRLHAATSDWLAVYARCRGVDVDPDVTVREAANVLIDTHDITDVAALLTGLHRA